MASMKDRLREKQLLSRMLTSPVVDGLLMAMQVQSAAPLSDRSEGGDLLLGVDEHAVGVFDLTLIPPPGVNPPRDYVLSFDVPGDAPGGFRLAVSLEDGPQRPLFDLISKLPGHGLRPARLAADGQSLEADPDPAAGPVQLVGNRLFLVLEGQVGGSVALRLSPNREAPDDVVSLQLQPPTVLLGGTGFGMHFTHGVVLDLAENAAAADRVEVDRVALDTPADAPAWQGIAVNRARFFLPKGVPFIGGHPVDAWLQIGLPPTPGIDVIVQARVPPDGERPAIDVRIECRDPTATGLDGFVPTLVEAVIELPLKDRSESFVQPIVFGAGKPVRARLRYARKPTAAGAAPSSELSLALESQGGEGLLKIDSQGGGAGATIAVTAATLATALIANGAAQTDTPDGDGSGVVLHTLLLAAVGLSSFLESGSVVLHGAELMSTGGTIPAGKDMRLKIDYSVAATVTAIDVGVLAVNMRPDQPFRVRVREVVLTIMPGQPGLEMIHLDYARSSLEVEDPGGWEVQGPGSLFDVLGTRSGRGSMWVEVDLRFKLDLGPVKVSGATIRATLDGAGRLKGELRGLDASITLQPMVSGHGAVTLTPGGFRAALQASVLPLGGLGASADVAVDDAMVKLSLSVDLPGPLPLANSGLAIYGLGGVFAANGKPRPVPRGEDPIKAALEWDQTDPTAFVAEPGALSFGLEAVIGTAPDMGFTFSARAGLFITAPDIVVRGAVEGRYLGPRMKLARGGNELSLLQAKGVVIVDPADGVTIAVQGEYKIPHVVTTTVPVGAFFPIRSNNWFIHLGADGHTTTPSESREGGPVRSIFLPDLIGQTADAYLMMRGNGITKWPRGGPVTIGPNSFVLAFGVGFDIVYGLKPVLWANVFLRADILVATNPMSFVGIGTVGGGLHIGIFSVGIDAIVHVTLIDGHDPHLKAQLCGSIDLFFDTIRKCVTLEYGSPAPVKMPGPPTHPLDGHAHALVDDAYRRLGALATRPEDATPEQAVWADSIPLLIFSTAPSLLLASAQFPGIERYPESLRARPIGSDLLVYDWELLGVTLVDAETDVEVAGPFSHAWQSGKPADACGQPQPAELALMTPLRDLWLHALADAGASLAEPPLAALAGICQFQAAARFGWALGHDATREGDGWRLPPNPRSADPLQSQLRVHVQLMFKPTAALPARVLTDNTAPLLPLQFAYTGPRVRHFDAQAMDGRSFDGWLDPGAALAPPIRNDVAFGRGAALHELRLFLDDAITDPRLWLVFETVKWTLDAAGRRPFAVTDDLARTWRPGLERELGAGFIAVRWLPPDGGAAVPVRQLLAHGVAGARIGALGLGGVTQSAMAAATARNAAAAAEADKQKEVAKDIAAKADAAPSPTRRCVLEPGRLYRIDVSMRWTGTLFEYDEHGMRRTLQTDASFGDTASLRQYWFRTAPVEPAGAVPAQGLQTQLSYLHRRRDLFDPAMLQRHLLGYNPAQSELQRFADDAVQAHFAWGHVALLAGAYGFQLLCGLRRLDQPALAEPDRLLVPRLLAPTSTALMAGSAGIIAQAYLDSACGLAANGVVLHADVKLTRDTWYEVFVFAKSKRMGVNDGALPGVSFRTSRWASGAEMLQGLGFLRSGARQADGGVALPRGTVLTPLVSEHDDGAFDAFLATLGLDGWPAADAPRASLLWLPPAGPPAPAAPWRCAGLLLESPEAIHRPGRFIVERLDLLMGPTLVDFDVRLRDRSGSRVLFATSAPFVPRRTRRGLAFGFVMPRLRLRCTDRPPGKPPANLQGLLEIPLQPSFAVEAQ